MTASKLMLDGILPQCLNQIVIRICTLGSVNSRNIVVACLPSGIYGITSVPIVLSTLIRAYCRYRRRVPNERGDIRLGGIVVSMLTLTSGGVVQYDCGEAIRDGCFEHTGYSKRRFRSSLPPSLNYGAILLHGELCSRTAIPIIPDMVRATQ
ncbi:hypothetical protein BJX99DRAFT_229523 [Aspergillus californicus]